MDMKYTRCIFCGNMSVESDICLNNNCRKPVPICPYGFKCWSKGDICLYLHPLVDCEQRSCRYGFRCRNKDQGCQFEHPNEDLKAFCRYGKKCYRKDFDHLNRFLHINDN